MTVLVIMGVSGSGKTTIARGLAKAEGWTLLEGNSFTLRRTSRRWRRAIR